jgi:hypothetical protein
VRFPVELFTPFPCHGYDADGRHIRWNGVLHEGDQISQTVCEDTLRGEPPFGKVVRHDDGTLWVEEDPTADAEHDELLAVILAGTTMLGS